MSVYLLVTQKVKVSGRDESVDTIFKGNRKYQKKYKSLLMKNLYNFNLIKKAFKKENFNDYV